MSGLVLGSRLGRVWVEGVSGSASQVEVRVRSQIRDSSIVSGSELYLGLGSGSGVKGRVLSGVRVGVSGRVSKPCRGQVLILGQGCMLGSMLGSQIWCWSRVYVSNWDQG